MPDEPLHTKAAAAAFATRERRRRFRQLSIGELRAVIAARLTRHHAEYSSALVLLAGVLFGFALIDGWVALCGAGIVVTAEEVFARRTSPESEQARETALGRS
jgi:hypothetical protein